jgi:3-mercaptopyruvate sulfurtransferase SseA
VAQELIEMGFKKVFALKGGWKEWSKAGYPIEKK